MNETRVMWWGASMYGGYYAEALVEGQRMSFHTEKLNELRKEVGEYGMKLEKWKRFDN